MKDKAFVQGYICRNCGSVSAWSTQGFSFYRAMEHEGATCVRCGNGKEEFFHTIACLRKNGIPNRVSLSSALGMRVEL